MRHAAAQASVRTVRPSACFPATSLQRIAEAIADSELRHTRRDLLRGRIRRCIRARCCAACDARERAQRGVRAACASGTPHANNGVLLYLLLADHRIEIVADRGFDGRGQRRAMARRVPADRGTAAAGEPEAAVLRGVEAMSALLAEHFPRGDGRRTTDNELPDLARTILLRA